MTGEELKGFREHQLHMTQEELAHHLDLTTRTLSGYENREGEIPVVVERAIKTIVTNPISY